MLSPASVLTVTVTVPPAPAPTWRSPREMNDLGPFNISSFSGGKHNLELIHDDTDGSFIQLLFPAGSINPAQHTRPIGGAQFYATPLDLAHAHNVSLGYSAFFPADFDWVRGGKMPGLYGGRSGCSGGSAALDCWSTRLMWRTHGRGELYLYAPKAKQPPSLCAAPRSVCSATYGLSIGRGAFAWAPGRWTRVVQTVTLNTPGRPDGCFVLDVDGARVIDRCDVFYRDVPKPTPKPTPTPDGDGEGGIGGLLGTLLSDLFPRATSTSSPTTTTTTTIPIQSQIKIAMDGHDAQQGWAVHPPSTSMNDDPRVTSPPAASTSPSASSEQDTDTDTDDGGDGTDNAEPTDINAQTHAHNNAPVGFKGLFFSSFFGGHTARYATPTDQYIYFKDFYMSCNS